MLLSEGGHDQQRHTKAIYILSAVAVPVDVSREPLANGCDRVHVVVPAAPVVPDNQNDGVALYFAHNRGRGGTRY